jgi:hypothetical protein
MILNNVYKPFEFPEGCRPNVSDPSTFETNYTISEIEIENILNLSLSNDSKWEEFILFDDDNENITNWEYMTRFGINEA